MKAGTQINEIAVWINLRKNIEHLICLAEKSDIYLAKTYYLCSKSGNSKQWCNKQLPDAVIRASSTHKSTVQAFRDMSSKDIFQQNMPTGFNIFSKHI